MKILPRVLFASLLGVVTSFAGGFGGPPPFQNGSPLQSGIDGTYQASMSGTNLTGIIRFSYSNGIQTGSGAQNTWVAYVDGSVFRGTPDTTIGEGGALTGVLDAANSVGNGSGGQTDLPIIFLVTGANTVGNFQANLALKNPYGQFVGKGVLTGSAAATNTLYVVSQATNGVISSVVIPIPINGGSSPETKFNLRGIRSSTTASGNFTNSTSSTN